jgi:hypothetical protein
MGFRQLLEEIEAVVDDRPPIFEPEGDENPYEGLDLSEDTDGEWTPATSVLWIASAIDELAEEFEGDEDAIVEYFTDLLAEAYKWSYAVDPSEKDVAADVGSVDEPPRYMNLKGFRGRASGLTPSAEEWFSAVLKTMMKKPPKPIKEYAIDVSVEVWKDVLGKAINKGIGVNWATDKKTGIQYPEPDYRLLYGMWKDKLAKLTGLRPTREKDQKMEKALDKHRSEMAKELTKGAEKTGKKRATQASTVMAGAKKKKRKKSA